jgi:hypothetical protein
MNFSPLFFKNHWPNLFIIKIFLKELYYYQNVFFLFNYWKYGVVLFLIKIKDYNQIKINKNCTLVQNHLLILI